MASAIGGISAMFAGYEGFTFASFVYGIAIALASAVGARIWCELMIVLFKINDNLKAIADKHND